MRRQDAVAFDVLFDLVERLAAVIRDDPRCHLAHSQDLFGHDANVGRLSRRTARRLVDQDARMRQRKTLALASRQHSSNAPIDAHWPTQIVVTSFLMNCIVS